MNTSSPSRSPIVASAPGSLMLLGEHAVLRGHRALVMAVDCRIRVTLSPRPDSTFRIESALGAHEGHLERLAPNPAFRFVMESVSRARSALPSGFVLQIDSEFSHTIGFGSSAAVTVATVAALRRFAGREMDVDAIRDEAIDIVRTVQGRGSGADVAASAHGGVVLYRAEPREAQRIDIQLSLLAVYCGYKTPTPEVIRRVEDMWRDRPAELEALFEKIGAGVERGAAALDRGDVSAFGRILNEGHALMVELGVSTPELETIVSRLRSHPECAGAKISGSGLGDCAIGLNAESAPNIGLPALSVRTERVGLLMHE